MDMKRIPIADITMGDWLMVPPGKGKHRGVPEDSGIFVVTDAWIGIGAFILGFDMLDSRESTIDIPNLIVDDSYVMVEVVR